MENEFDYYIPKYLSSLLVLPTDEYFDEFRKNIGKKMELDIINMNFDKPYHRKSIILDFFEMSVISKKIFNILSPMTINGIQLIPITFFNQEHQITFDNNFYHLRIYNKLECFDNNNSIYVRDYDNGLLKIKKLVLDEEKLSKIPLKERTIFNLSNDNLLIGQLFHKSIVDKIMTVNPQGIRFINIKDYKRKQ